METTRIRLFVLICLSSIIDAFATLRLVAQRGTSVEANPFMRYCMEVDPILFFLMKVFLTVGGVGILLFGLSQTRLSSLSVRGILWMYCLLLFYHLFIIIFGS